MNLLTPPAREPTAIDAWNDVVGPKFIRFRDVIVGNARGHDDLAVSLAQRGQRVLDVGCGFGDTAARLLDRVGPGGEVVGVDCTTAFLDIARTEVDGVRFAELDASVDDLGGPYDLVFSRFGTMFFPMPVAALAHLRAALAPTGQLAMVTWRPLDDNPWLALPKALAYEWLPMDEPPTISCGPGPFSMADTDLVTRQLEAAGFADITFTPTDSEAFIGATVDEAVVFQLAVGPAGERVREASARGPVDLDGLEAALHELLAPFERADGVYLPSAAWTVCARRGV